MFLARDLGEVAVAGQPTGGWGHRIAAVVLGFALAFALGEIGFRIAGFDPLAELTRGRSSVIDPTEHPDLPYLLAPNASGFFWGTDVELNAHGFRDAPRALEKPPGTWRVLVLGDSIAFGNLLPVEDRFTERLAQRLATGRRNVEVLNLAVPGYDTLNQAALLEVAGIGFEPDEIVVTYCINDAGVHSANLTVARLLQRHGWWLRASRLGQLVVTRGERLLMTREILEINDDPTFRKIYAGRIEEIGADQRARIARLRDHLDGRSSQRTVFLDWYTSEAKVGRLRHAFGRIAHVARTRNLPATVLLVPFLDEGSFGPGYELAYSIIRHEVQRAGMEVVDVREAFLARGFETLRIERRGKPDSLHPNRDGHSLMAEALRTHLARRM